MSPPPPPARTARPAGLLLVAPALIALLACYVVPAMRTLWGGFQRTRLFRDEGGEFTGFDNYARIAEAGFFGDLGYALLLAVPPVLAACVVAPVLAWLAHRGGTPARRTVRLALVLPMVALTPAGLALAWSAARIGLTGEPLRAQLLVGRVLALTLFGLLVGAGVTVFLSALRRGGGARPVRAVISIGLATGLAVVAYTLQTWTFPYALTQGGPRDATGTPLLTIYNLTFRYADLGAGAAGGTVLGLLLGVLGLAAVAVLVLGRVRADVVAPASGTRPAGPAALIGALVLLAAVLAVTGYGLRPWLSALGAQPPSFGSTLNTWAPPLVSTVIGVGLAALAGFGIGALRPLGRHSELLLFLFAPWLFVGTGPFSAVHFRTLHDLGLADTPVALIPPVFVSIPSLVVFTLLFRGLAERRPGNPVRTLLPALPMAAALGTLTYLMQAQDAFWQTITVNDPDALPTPAAALRFGAEWLFSGEAASLPMPVPAVVLFALVLAALQWFYLDRLSIRTTPPEPSDVMPAPVVGGGRPAQGPHTPGYPAGHPQAAGYPGGYPQAAGYPGGGPQAPGYSGGYPQAPGYPAGYPQAPWQGAGHPQAPDLPPGQAGQAWDRPPDQTGQA